jgi:hypothetical protein
LGQRVPLVFTVVFAQKFLDFGQHSGEPLGIFFRRLGRGAGLSDDADVDLSLVRFGGDRRFAGDGDGGRSRSIVALLGLSRGG